MAAVYAALFAVSFVCRLLSGIEITHFEILKLFLLHFSQFT